MAFTSTLCEHKLIEPQWASVEGYGLRNEPKIDRHDPQALETFWLLATMNGASTVGRLTMAAFSDKVGQLNMHIVAQIISSLLVLILWTLSNSTASAIAFCVLFGMTSGTVIGLPPASMANILAGTYPGDAGHHSRHGKLGHWTGMMYTAAAIPALCGPTIAGTLIAKYDTYITVQLWSGANLFISAVFMMLARWHLPCGDGEHVRVHLARMLGKRQKFTEKGKESQTDTDNTDVESQNGQWLQAPKSVQPSRSSLTVVPTAAPAQLA